MLLYCLQSVFSNFSTEATKQLSWQTFCNWSCLECKTFDFQVACLENIVKCVFPKATNVLDIFNMLKQA